MVFNKIQRYFDDTFMEFFLPYDVDIDYKYINDSSYDDVFFECLCGCGRYNNWYVRNSDWYTNYDGYNRVLKTEKNVNRNGNICIAAISQFITLDTIAFTSNEARLLNILFSTITDGINDKGLICSVSLVKNSIVGGVEKYNIPEAGTNPGATTNIFAGLVCKYILDKYNSVDDVIANINNDLNIKCPRGRGYEYHWLISDSSKSAYIEIIETGGISSIKILKTDDASASTKGWSQSPIKAMMTNFRLTPASLYTNGYMVRNNTTYTASLSNIEMYGRGVERYNSFINRFKTFSTPDLNDIRNFVTGDLELDDKDVITCRCNNNFKNEETLTKFGKAFPLWCTDFAGVDNSLYVYSKLSDYKPFVTNLIDEYINHVNLTTYNMTVSGKWLCKNTCAIDLNPQPMRDDPLKNCYKVYIFKDRVYKVKDNVYLNIIKDNFEFELEI